VKNSRRSIYCFIWCLWPAWRDTPTELSDDVVSQLLTVSSFHLSSDPPFYPTQGRNFSPVPQYAIRAWCTWRLYQWKNDMQRKWQMWRSRRRTANDGYVKKREYTADLVAKSFLVPLLPTHIKLNSPMCRDQTNNTRWNISNA
jgi:hypothetical protein